MDNQTRYVTCLFRVRKRVRCKDITCTRLRLSLFTRYNVIINGTEFLPEKVFHFTILPYRWFSLSRWRLTILLCMVYSGESLHFDEENQNFWLHSINWDALRILRNYSKLSFIGDIFRRTVASIPEIITKTYLYNFDPLKPHFIH